MKMERGLPVPTRFEDDCPEEAAILADICQERNGKKNHKPIFLDGTMPVVKSEIKVGRNDPCPCGSGKKYKKCCA
jgi:uncharacterized protein YecA (UPF0149 family)